MPNPFLPRKQTTVRREKDQVYPHRKGLNQPEFLGDSPLDHLFVKLQELLSQPLDQISVDSLAQQLEIDASLPPNELRYAVVSQLLDYLLEIQTLAKKSDSNPDLIAISLHDIKTFGKLVSTIVVLGIYPALAPLRVGIPLEKRRLNDFGKPLYKPLQVGAVETAGSDFSPLVHLLVLVYDRLHRVFATDSDVKNLLMKGVGFSDYLVVAITLATAPFVDSPTKKRVLAEFDSVAATPTTYDLYQDYSLLLSTPSPPFVKHFVMQKLQLVPYNAPRGDGVLTLVEFVLGLRDTSEINIEKFDHVASVLLSKPKSLSAPAYFTAIGRQCCDILVNINRPTITSCVGHFLEKLWLKNPLIVRDFFFKTVWDNLNPAASEKLVLVSEKDLNNTINILVSLTSRSIPPDMIEALFAPILVSLWTYYAFLRRSEKPHEVVQNILVSYFTQIQGTDNSQLDEICRHLVAEHEWKFRLGPNKLPEIYSPDTGVDDGSAEKRVLAFVQQLDSNCGFFVDLLKQLDDSMIQRQFIALLSRWADDKSVGENPFVKLVDLRLLEKIGSELTDRLAQTPLEILQVVEKTLQMKKENVEAEEADSDDEDEDDSDASVVPVLLELLSAIISETTPAELDSQCRDVLVQIQKTLKEKHAHLKTATAVSSRIDFLLRGEKPADSELEVQKRTFTRAIASLNDPLVPIRAHGLYLLRELVEHKSPVISVDFVVNLHLVQLKDPEPFVYLNVIKGLQSLLEADPRSVLPVLLEIYATGKETKPEQSVEKDSEHAVKREDVLSVKEESTEEQLDDSKSDALSEADLDEKLRVGESILRFVQSQDEAFSGEYAASISTAALKIIRRPANDDEKADDRLRMSAMSILGTCCNTNVLGIVGEVGNALDCSIGILQLETTKDSAIMRRAAIVLIHDLIVGTSKSDKVPFPRVYMSKVINVLRYVEGNDTDLLVREQATSVLEYIDELVQIAFADNE